MQKNFKDKNLLLEQFLLCTESKFWLCDLQELSDIKSIKNMVINEGKEMKTLEGRCLVNKTDYEALRVSKVLVGMQVDLRYIKRSQVSIDEKMTKIREITIDLKEISSKLYRQIKETEKVLRKSIFGVGTVRVPTCFVITNKILELEVEGSQDMTMFNHVLEFLKYVDDSTDSNAMQRTALDIIFPSDGKYFFYFVNESTMLLVLLPKNHRHRDKYLIRVEIRKWLEKLLPIMSLSLKLEAFLNSVAGVAQMFGYPSAIIGELIASGRELIDKMKNQDTAIFFEGITTMLNEIQNINGSSRLHELENFYKEYEYGDIWNKVGLCKYLDTEGNVC